MSLDSWLVPTILIILIIIGVMLIARKKNKRPIDYYSLFVIGLIWLVIGIPMALSSRNYALPGLGLIFMITGLVNRGKWRQNRRTWSQFNEREKKSKMIMLIILGVLVLIGLALYYFTKNNLI